MFNRRSFNIFLILLLVSCTAVVPAVLTTPSSPVFIERGKRLVKGLAACGRCHGEQNTPSSLLAGGRRSYDQFGEVYAPNLTPSETGLGLWDARQIAEALRASVNREGEAISYKVHEGYEWMSDQDLYSIVAYLKSLPPVDNEVARREISLTDRYTTGILEKDKTVPGYIPDLDRKDKQVYGQYLVDHVARCGACHNRPSTLFSEGAYLEGGEAVKNDAGSKVAPNITNSKVHGIGNWGEEAIVKYLKTGETPAGRYVDPNFCPVDYFKNAADEDLAAIAAYLHNL